MQLYDDGRVKNQMSPKLVGEVVRSVKYFLRASQILRRKLRKAFRHGEERSAKINEKTYKNVLYFVAKLHKR